MPYNTGIIIPSGTLPLRHFGRRKRRADTHPLAVETKGELYYFLPDPTGLSLTLAQADGTAAGYLVYDAYGKTLSSTLSSDLETALAGQDALPDPDTNLVYLGGGRFYDPGLGRSLQPNPAGGPPTVP